jgi:hypothetical protein
MAMTPAVLQAIDELQASFPNANVSATADGSGGALVRLDVVDPGSPYRQRETWVGFHLGFQYPHADVYPHFVRADLARLDDRPLVPPFHSGHPSQWGLAVMISRRSNRHDPTTATAATKLISVLEWMAAQ